jgi:putative ABC transport system substrate-binding protein
LALLGGAAVAWPLGVRAQQKAMPVIGILGVASPNIPGVALNLDSFWQGLKESGYVEGQTVAAEYCWAENHYDRLPALADELVRRKVDVIVNEGGRESALAARNATSTIPIVFHTGDAAAGGLVTSLARPGGNLTGVSRFGPETFSKLFQLASDLVPQAKVTGIHGVRYAVRHNSVAVIHDADECHDETLPPNGDADKKKAGTCMWSRPFSFSSTHLI